MPETSPPPAAPPLVIGATGGSGTRVVARIARLAGYEMGTNLNPAGDGLEFLPFHEKWIDRVIELERNREPAPMTSPPSGLVEDFHAVLDRHLAAAAADIRLPARRWGWKAPRSIYLLPFFHGQYPGMKFIHVLRDGRDMAFSKNQNQLTKHGRRLLSWRERWCAPLPVRSILLWDRVNGRAAAYGETQLRENYIAIRFEDLCQSPVETVARILRFLDAPGDAEALARAEISQPSTLGRWRTQPPALISRMNTAGAGALRKLGYLAP